MINPLPPTYTLPPTMSFLPPLTTFPPPPCPFPFVTTILLSVCLSFLFFRLGFSAKSNVPKRAVVVEIAMKKRKWTFGGRDNKSEKRFWLKGKNRE